MSSNEVGHTKGLNVKIHGNKNKKQENISFPSAQKDYVRYFNDVDKNDNDISFYLS